MTKKVSVAILGSTGFVGLELIKILSKHPNVNIVFFGTENNPYKLLKDIDPSIVLPNNPSTDLNANFDSTSVDIMKSLEENPYSIYSDRERYVMSQGLNIYRALYKRNNNSVPKLSVFEKQYLRLNI